MNRYLIKPPTPMNPREYFEWLHTLPFVWPAERAITVDPLRNLVETMATIAGYPLVVFAPGERANKWIISRLAMRKRLTLAERADIEVAAADNPAATAAARLRSGKMRTFMADLMSAEKVNLRDPIVVGGFEQIETFGLIATGRAAQITDTEPTDDERYGF